MAAAAAAATAAVDKSWIDLEDGPSDAHAIVAPPSTPCR
jgi:hypothetical protein